jgi:hypothetical protein
MAPLGGNERRLVGGNERRLGGNERRLGEASALGYAGHGLMSDCATVWQSAA